MILLLDTSTGLCKVTLVDGDHTYQHEWQADRQLAKGLLGFLRDSLSQHQEEWSSLTGLGVFKGPGSFTGLRIGITVLNTIATDRHIPIVGCTELSWQKNAIGRLEAGENDQIVLPFYGREANITTPKK